MRCVPANSLARSGRADQVEPGCFGQLQEASVALSQQVILLQDVLSSSDSLAVAVLVLMVTVAVMMVMLIVYPWWCYSHDGMAVFVDVMMCSWLDCSSPMRGDGDGV